MIIWEYKTVTLFSINREEQLNLLGFAGWQLITIKQGVAYFQRPREVSGPSQGATETVTTSARPSGKKK